MREPSEQLSPYNDASLEPSTSAWDYEMAAGILTEAYIECRGYNPLGENEKQYSDEEIVKFLSQYILDRANIWPPSQSLKTLLIDFRDAHKDCFAFCPDQYKKNYHQAQMEKFSKAVTFIAYQLEEGIIQLINSMVPDRAISILPFNHRQPSFSIPNKALITTALGNGLSNADNVSALMSLWDYDVHAVALTDTFVSNTGYNPLGEEERYSAEEIIKLLSQHVLEKVNIWSPSESLQTLLRCFKAAHLDCFGWSIDEQKKNYHNEQVQEFRKAETLVSCRLEEGECQLQSVIARHSANSRLSQTPIPPTARPIPRKFSFILPNGESAATLLQNGVPTDPINNNIHIPENVLVKVKPQPKKAFECCIVM